MKGRSNTRCTHSFIKFTFEVKIQTTEAKFKRTLKVKLENYMNISNLCRIFL